MRCVRCEWEIEGEPVIHQPSGWPLCEACACAHNICDREEH